jgi:hypothetical protein
MTAGTAMTLGLWFSYALASYAEPCFHPAAHRTDKSRVLRHRKYQRTRSIRLEGAHFHPPICTCHGCARD